MVSIQNIITVFLCTSSVLSQLQDGDLCKDEGKDGICRKLIDCPSAMEAIKRGERPYICSFDGLLPTICCIQVQHRVENETFISNSKSEKSSEKSAKWCMEYSKYVRKKIDNPSLVPGGADHQEVDECSIVTEPLILGGKDALPNEFPHMVLIGYGEEPKITYHCGGSLISERFVLSAAHCTKIAARGLAKWVRFGANRNSPKLVVRIKNRINHPDYIKYYNDIALYELERNIELSPEMRPLCLHREHSIPSKKAIASGWGYTDNDGDLPDESVKILIDPRDVFEGTQSETLQKVTLDLVSSSKCNFSYASYYGDKLKNGIVDDEMLCAGGLQGKDTCNGDSGGPLQIVLEKPYCMYSVVGITSFGKSCGSDSPAIYTRVSNYIKWIENIVWP